jgi:nicotinamide mononucleotide transporter PnuC
MDWNIFFQIFIENLRESSVWEIIAVVFGIISVWFAHKANIFVYPTGIISTTIYIIICYSFQLYADMGINTFYTGMSIYGWYVWTRKNGPKRPGRSDGIPESNSLIGIAMIPILVCFYSWFDLVFYERRCRAAT